MSCPHCGNVDVHMKGNRPAEVSGTVRRVRFRLACCGRFTICRSV